MTESVGKPNDPDLVLADLLEQLAHRVQQGEVLDVERIRSEYPEHAERLQEMVPVLEFLVDLSECGVERHGRPGASLEPAPAAAPADRRGVLGDFRILREIGCGGMGVVYEAEQISLGRHVALKVLPFATMLDARQVLRFQNESRAAASLDHPNIVKVYSVGLDRGVHYFAMQYIEGRTLAALIAELRRGAGLDRAGDGKPESSIEQTSGAILLAFAKSAEPQTPTRTMAVDGAEALEQEPPCAASTTPASAEQISTVSPQHKRSHFRAIARLGIQAAEALEHAHQMGIVHRDIKPANLLIDSTGHLWVTDFGLARTQTESNLTITGDVLGTPRYMSPEQLAGDRRVLDHRSDVYSLGVSLYELVTLHPAFAETDRNRLVTLVAEQEPPPMRRFDKSVPRELETVVLKAMAKEPAARYGSAQELAEDLERFLDDKPILARRATTMARLAKWSRRNRPIVLAAGTILLLAAILGPSIAVNQTYLRRTAEIHAQREAAAHLEAVGERNRAEANLHMAVRAVDEMYTQLADDYLTESPQVEPLKLDFLKRAARFYGDFAAANGDNASLGMEVVKAYQRQGRAHFCLGQYADGEKAYAAAYRLLKQEYSGRSPALEVRIQLARCCDGLGFLLRRCRRYAEAEELHLEAIRILDELLAECSDTSGDYASLAAHVENNLGLCYMAEGKLSEAEERFRKSLKMKEQLVADDPTNNNYRYLLSFSLHDLASVLQKQERAEEAKPYCERAIEEKEWIVRENPRAPEASFQLAITYAQYATLLNRDDPVESESLWEKSLAILQRLVNDRPDVPIYLSSYGISSYNAAIGFHRNGDIAKANSLYRQSIAAIERYIQLEPDNLVPFLNYLAWRLATCPDVSLRDPVQAVALAEKAVGLAPQEGRYVNTLGACRYRVGDWRGSIEALTKSMALRGGDPYDWFFLAMAHWQLNERQDGRRYYDQAVAYLDASGPHNGEETALRIRADELVRLHAEAAEVMGLAGQLPSEK